LIGEYYLNVPAKVLIIITSRATPLADTPSLCSVMEQKMPRRVPAEERGRERERMVRRRRKEGPRAMVDRWIVNLSQGKSCLLSLILK